MSRPRTIKTLAGGEAELPLTVGAGSRFDRRPPLPKRSILWFLIPFGFIFTVFYGASRQLVPDEAFYWVLSRHLAAGYLDHPPMVAYVIRAGTFIFGVNELGVRFGSAVMAFASLLVLLAICRRMLRDDRALLFLGIIWLCSPLMAALGTLATPDTPSTFFSVCALAIIIVIAKREPSGSVARRLGLWTTFGIATGLAMLSKYTAVLPAGAALLAMLTTPTLRRELRSPGPWVAVIVILSVFSPVILWNQHHDWASFRFQLHHGLDEQRGNLLASIGEYVVGQFGIWTPVLMIVGLVVIAKNWAVYRSLDAPRRLLVWSATIPLVFFGVAALKSGAAGEANWPGFAYFPLSLLIVDDLHRDWKHSGVKWVRIGIGVALAVSVMLHSPELLLKITGPKHFPRKLNEFFGWREMSRSVAKMAEPGTLFVAGRHQDAGELSFYLLPDHPDVWCYPAYDATGKLVSRPTAFDYMDDRPVISTVPEVTFVGYWSHAEAFAKTYGFHTLAVQSWFAPVNGLPRSRDVIAFERFAEAPPATTPASGKSNRHSSTTQSVDRLQTKQ